MTKNTFFLTIVFIFSGFFPVAAEEFYKYEDDKGLIHLTNDLSAIPEKFRSSVKIIKEDSLAQKEEPKTLSKEEIIKDAKKAVTIARGEAEKFWWRWIVDPKSGATRIPVIIGGYLLAAIGTLIFIRRHLSGRLYKVAMKAALLGFAAIIILTYSAHRGHKAYKKFKASPLNDMAAEVLKKGN